MATNQNSRERKRQSGWLWLALLLILSPRDLWAETVKLPMTVEYSLLRTLIVEQAYPEAGERAEIVAMNDGCNEVWLANPQLAEENGDVRYQTEMHVTWGTPVAGNCIAPIRWSGSIVFWQQPAVDDLWRLRFTTRNSMLLNQAGEKAAIPGLIWDLVKKNVHDYIDSIAISLAPPVDNVKQLLRPQAAGDGVELSAADQFLASMRPEQPQVKKNGLAINILADVLLPPPSELDELGVPPIEDPEAQERIMALWRTWDALLVNMIGQLSARELTVEDRQLLLDTLLAVRYEFSEVLGGPGLTTNFVRRQFIESWISLKPLFERHLTPRPADSMLGYLSFFTAADALVVLDRLGPVLGIDVSREGFYRLAHMLSDQKLDESGAVDNHLRDVLGIGAPLAVPVAEPPLSESPPLESPPLEPPPVTPPPAELVPAEPGESLPAAPGSMEREPPAKGEAPFAPVPNEELLNDTEPGVFAWPDWRKLLAPAEACAATTPQQDQVSGWTAGITPASQLLPRVRKVLVKVAGSQEEKFDAAVGEEGWGQRLLEATAWQESCFRQFIVKDKKITYLLSYNNTSVGVMQVNEKVWRGIYDVQELRWNVEYNIMAGSEILALYLNRYLGSHKDFKRYSGDTAGNRYLATWLYALYNAGPAQLKKFPQRTGTGKKLNRIERSFQEKFDKVGGQDWGAQVKCLPAS